MLRKTLIALSIALSGTVALAQDAAPLQLKVYNADENSFSVTSTLVSGPKEAVLIDTGFTKADAYRIAANVLDSGKQLTTILISNADPDYYFGAEVLKQIFPQAKLVTTPAVLEKIQAKMPAKLEFWGPKMGANAPTKPLLPEVLQGNTLKVDGQTMELRGTSGVLAHRPYVWIPSVKTITGNVGVVGNLHVWTADTQKPEEQKAWVAQLKEMQALKPEVVIPGHMQAGAAMDGTAIEHTLTYLQRFDAEAAKAKNSAELATAMKQAYPNAGGATSLDIGTKVRKGEMKW